MTEAEILELISIHRGNILGLMQWWASVSFALVALAHFGRKSLNAVLTSVVLALYVAFSLFTAFALYDQLSLVYRHLDDIGSLVAEGANASSASDYFALIDRSSVPFWMFRIVMVMAIVGTFLGCIAYVLYVFKSRRKQVQNL